jgi:hypothetical protein
VKATILKIILKLKTDLQLTVETPALGNKKSKKKDKLKK